MMGRFNDKNTSEHAAQAQVAVTAPQSIRQQIILT